VNVAETGNVSRTTSGSSCTAVEVLSDSPLSSAQLHEQLDVLERRMQGLATQLPTVSKEHTIGIARTIRLHRQGLHTFLSKYGLPTPTPTPVGHTATASDDSAPVDKLAELKTMSAESLQRVLLYVGVLRERLRSPPAASDSPAERDFCCSLHAELDQLSAIPH
jgi:hypothetical protein